jgi:hypothetical protein
VKEDKEKKKKDEDGEVALPTDSSASEVGITKREKMMRSAEAALASVTSWIIACVSSRLTLQECTSDTLQFQKDKLEPYIKDKVKDSFTQAKELDTHEVTQGLQLNMGIADAMGNLCMLENVTDFVETSTNLGETPDNMDYDYCPRTITLLSSTLTSSSLPMETEVLMELGIVRWAKGLTAASDWGLLKSMLYGHGDGSELEFSVRSLCVEKRPKTQKALLVSVLGDLLVPLHREKQFHEFVAKLIEQTPTSDQFFFPDVHTMVFEFLAVLSNPDEHDDSRISVAARAARDPLHELHKHFTEVRQR